MTIVKNKLPYDFFTQDTVTAAQKLLGKKITTTIQGITVSGYIVETESYSYPDDPASHAYRGQTERNMVLFGPVAHCYVYISYGIHYCLNIIARSPDQIAGGVLIRALEPYQGIEIMKHRRHMDKIKLLTNGPGKVCQALGITKEYNGLDLMHNDAISISSGYDVAKSEIVATSRVGISAGQEFMWRFYINNNPFISKK